MNNNSPKDPSDFALKQESSDHHHQHEKGSSSASSSQWLRLKDPRIVRVSRAFGGKDRHSKVCTIRGLRDRRVRLSVPTAIQLYDLQDRLGLNQPSKVVDWLLNAAKHEIDELPPLPTINNPFTLSGFPSSSSNEASTSMFNINRSIHQWQGLAQSYSKWNNNKSKSSSTKQASSEDNHQMVNEEDNNNKEEKEGDNEEGANVVSVSTTNNHHHHHHPSFLGLLNTIPIGNYQFEQHNSSNDVNVAQLGNHHHGFVTNQTDLQSINVVPFPSTLSLSTGGNNITQSYFPSHSSEAMDNSNNNMDPRQEQQINHHYHHHQYHQMLTSHHLHQNLLTNNLPSFSLAMMSTPILLHHSHNTRESSSHQSHHKDHHFPSSSK